MLAPYVPVSVEGRRGVFVAYVWRGGEGCMCGVKGGMYVWCGGVCVWRRGVVGGEGCSYGIGVCSALLIYHTPFFSSQS